MSQPTVRVFRPGEEEPFWAFRAASAEATRVVTVPLMTSPLASPGCLVTVDDKPAGTVETVGREGVTGQWFLALQPPPKPKAKPKAKKAKAAARKPEGFSDGKG